MTDPISIAAFKQLNPKKTYTSCIQVKVISVTVPEDGLTDGRKWQIQKVTVADKTGELKLALFNGRIGKLMLGKSYLICDLGVDSYKTSTTPKVVPATTIREVATTTDDYLKNKQQEIQGKLKSLPKLAEKLEKLSIEESTIMYQMKKTVEANISQYETLPNQGMIWLMAEKVFDRHCGVKN